MKTLGAVERWARSVVVIIQFFQLAIGGPVQEEPRTQLIVDYLPKACVLQVKSDGLAFRVTAHVGMVRQGRGHLERFAQRQY